MDQAGAIIGPLAAFALFPLVGFMRIFYLSLVPAAIAVIILIFFVKEKLAPVQVKKSIAGNIQAVLAEKRFVALLAIMGVFSVGAFNFAFVLIRGSDLGISDSMVLLLYVIINGAYTLVGYPVGMLADRIGREAVLAISYGVFLASTVLMLISTSSIHAFTSLPQSMVCLHRHLRDCAKGAGAKIRRRPVPRHRLWLVQYGYRVFISCGEPCFWIPV
jgi:nitrate/nitrite transporter NarK